MRKLLLLFALLLSGSAALAQTSGLVRYDGYVQPAGYPFGPATIAVCSAGGSGGPPCSPRAVIYTDASGTQQQLNPFTINPNGNGNYTFYALGSTTYALQSYGTGYTTTLTSITLPAASGGGGSSIGGSLGSALNVKNPPYNAVGDGKIFWDGVTNGGNNQLTSATITFAASDVGHNLSCTVTPSTNTATLWTPGQVTVASFISSTTITYSGANAGVQSGLACKITNPADAPAIAAAFAACKTTSKSATSQSPIQGNGCNIYLPAGNYGFNATLDSFVSTGAEQCVGIIGDGVGKSGLIPEATFTSTANGSGSHLAWAINMRCNAGYLYNFFLADASTPRASGPNASGAIEFQSGGGYLGNVSLYDLCNTNGATVFGFDTEGGTNMVFDHISVFNNGNCGGATSNGGMQLVGVGSTDVYSPFLSNTQKNLNISTQTAGNNGNGLRFWGGVVDEGSVTTVVNSVAVWITGTLLTGGANCLSVDATSIVHYTGGYCGTFGVNTGSGPTVASGGKLLVTGVETRGQNANNYCWNSATLGGIVDLGGNLCTLAGGATFYNVGSAANLSALTHSMTNYVEGVVNLAASTIGTWTPDQVTNVTRIQAANTAGNVTCATPLVLQLSNGTTTQTLTLTSGQSTWDSGVITGQYAAGTLITLTQTAAGACAVPPVNLNISILWNASQGP